MPKPLFLAHFCLALCSNVITSKALQKLRVSRNKEGKWRVTAM